jgi:hypothetical protein
MTPVPVVTLCGTRTVRVTLLSSDNDVTTHVVRKRRLQDPVIRSNIAAVAVSVGSSELLVAGPHQNYAGDIHDSKLSPCG